VPRFFWRDKPEFNRMTNYFLARRLGLLHWEDPYTSWGVNYIAETIWNFGLWTMVLALPLFFVGANLIDRYVNNRLHHPLALILIESAFFFFFMQMVGIVTASTYILWVILLGILLEKLVLSQQTRTYQRRLPAALAFRPHQ
jgi:hypothetical protein